MLRRDLYTLRHSLWRRSHVTNPVINDIRTLALPRETVLHYLDAEGIQLGPRISDPMMSKVEGLRYIHHLTEYYKPDIPPIRKLGTNITTMITEYRNKNRSFRRLLNASKAATDPKALLIYNYSMVTAAYGFTRSPRAPWYEFRAQMSTLFHSINTVSKQVKRGHFFIVDLPNTMPAMSDFISLFRNFSNTTLRTIPTFEEKFLFEMFKWLGRGTKDSIFTQLDPKILADVNIIFKRHDKWISINLAWITGLTKSHNPKAQYDAKQFESVFIKLLTEVHLAGRPFTVSVQDVDDTQGNEEDDEEVSDSATEEERIELETLDINKLIRHEDIEDDDDVPGYSEDELIRLEKELLEVAGRPVEAESVDIIELDDEELEALGRIDDGPSLSLDVMSEITGFDVETNASVALAGKLNAKGIMSNAEYQRIVRVSDRFNDIADPYDPTAKLADVLAVDIADLELEEAPTVDERVLIDKSLGRAKVDQFEQTYVKDFLRKDIMTAVSALQKGPVSVTDYTVETTEDSQNKFETHTIKITPVVGAPSTIRQILPVVEEDGTFKYNGTSYRMKMQRVDMPIRKISATTVALNSYYGKLFVELNQKSSSDYTGKLVRWIKAKLIDPTDTDFTDGSISDVSANDPKIPLVYGSISAEVERFTIASNKAQLNFAFNKRFSALKVEEDLGLKIEGKNRVLLGKRGSVLYLLNASGVVLEYKDDQFTEVGTLEEFIGLDTTQYNLPTPQVGMKIYSKVIPVGFCMAYLLGWEALLKVLKSKPRYVNMGERPNLAADEYAIRFKNQTVVFKRTNVLETMILSGITEYAKYIKDYDVAMFESKDVYNAIMDRVGVGNRYMKKLDSTSIYFIDPITESILTMMNEPTEFNALILRACEMLTTSYIPKESDGARKSAKGLTRLRGYDRVAGFAYESMVKAIEAHSMRATGGRVPITINPWDTMNVIRSDPTVAPADSLNPIQFLREREIITHTGRGGRNKRSMVARSRIFQDEDIGVISEATVDSGDVGVIVYASPDADIQSIYGTTGEAKSGDKVDSAKLLSTAALLSPNADGDDPKRISFISVQHGHGIQAKGYETQPLRTGVERTVAHRMNDTFAQMADGDGTVTEITDDYVAIKYKSGDVKKYQIGERIITSTGSKYPQVIVTTATKVGDKYKKGDCIAYNKGFFSVNPLEKNKVDYMSGCLVRTALREAGYTLEDSCAISSELADRLMTVGSEGHPIRVSFDEEIANLVKIGDRLNIGDPLCLIEDSVSSAVGAFDEATRSSLALLSTMSPTSKVAGVVTQIEVHYKGDIDFMSPSLAKLAKSTEAQRKRLAKSLDRKYISNEINGDVRISGQTVGTDEAIIIVYVNTDVPCGIGDKLVFGNQGKSTVGEVLSGNTRTAAGEPIDAIFGAKSFIDRIITSPFKNGLCNSYLMAVGDIAYEMWTDSK